jgi:hypothetical protein
MREDRIETAIRGLPGNMFERFARELVARELYPGLNPTSDSHDLGEDARTEHTTVFLHNGIWVSLLLSKTGTWTKLQADCKRCKETGRRINVVVFVTADNPRSDTVEDWREKVKRQFNWELEVRALRWLAPAASRPVHDSLVDDYLGIPPPDGDFIQTIEVEFSRHTEHALSQISLEIPGLSHTLQRSEIARVEDQLRQGKSVILAGEAGTGKSGVAACLARSVAGKVVLLLDARRVGHIRSEAELRRHLALSGPVVSAVRRVGLHRGCLVIVDQLDNIAGYPSATVLIETVADLQALDGVGVVVVSRRREGHETKLLECLVKKGFVELASFPLSESEAAKALTELDISKPSRELIAIGRNLLNLEMIGRIKQEQPSFQFSTLTDEVDLWEQYIDVLVEREAVGSGIHDAEQIVAEAVNLARAGLMNEDRTFCLGIALSHPHQRLISWGIVICEGGRVYRFHHEKLQDFLYAWGATQRNAMPADVLGEINVHRSRNIFTWMDRIYSRRSPEVHKRFLRKMLNVQ